MTLFLLFMASVFLLNRTVHKNHKVPQNSMHVFDLATYEDGGI